MIEVTPRDVEPYEFSAYFSNHPSIWRVAAEEKNSMQNDNVIRWIIDNAPEQGQAPAFFAYEEVYRLSCQGYDKDRASKVVRESIKQYSNELFSSRGVAVQTGARSRDGGKVVRGIRIMRCDS